ncbi:MAG: DoxX family protein [Microvirga sp.]
MSQSTRPRILPQALSERNLAWLGWLLSGLVVLVLGADSAVSLGAPSLIEADMAATGFPTRLAPILGTMIFVSALLYAIPRTAVLGAILVTAFLGGAIAIHFRLGEIGSPPQIVSLGLGVLAWGGLYLRDARVRALLPLVSSGQPRST